VTDIIIDSEEVRVQLGRQSISFPRIPLPPAFLEWQATARQHMFERMTEAGAQAIRRQPAHLPVLATFGQGPFPANLATRGMGLLPAPAYLEEFTRRFEAVLSEAEGRPWSESLPERVRVVKEFYDDVTHFDSWLLGGLEIFEGRTAENLQRNPLASLLYTGEPPAYPSYQFDGVVQFVEAGDPHFRFLLAARELFARDAFHIHQIRYPYGYLFHLAAVRDKTPYPRRDHGAGVEDRE